MITCFDTLYFCLALAVPHPVMFSHSKESMKAITNCSLRECVVRLTYGCALLFAVCIGALDSHATVLTFEGVSVANAQALPQTYGDNVSSAGPDANGHLYAVGNGFTPNIQLSYGPGTDVRYWNDAAWPKVAYLVGTVNDFTFTPDPGFGVKINSFDLVDYPDYGGGHTNTWTVYKDAIAVANILGSGTVVLPPNQTASITTGLAPYMGTTILRITQVTQEVGDDLALDNLNFDQVVPEPSAATLLGLGGMLVWRRWKK
jgi:hypothetical protein